MCSDVQRWPQTERVWHQFERLDLVMERTGVDRLRAAREDRGKALAEARDRCLACLVERRCAFLLAGGDPAAIMAICPNAAFLRQCRKDDPASS
ncbi:MAG: hypothetical protein J0H53_15255 [Rhizobiales bacterium]|nr:hypothetical protein [Hyphomicrobiales bacterium]